MKIASHTHARTCNCSTKGFSSWRYSMYTLYLPWIHYFLIHDEFDFVEKGATIDVTSEIVATTNRQSLGTYSYPEFLICKYKCRESKLSEARWNRGLQECKNRPSKNMICRVFAWAFFKWTNECSDYNFWSVYSSSTKKKVDQDDADFYSRSTT